MTRQWRVLLAGFCSMGLVGCGTVRVSTLDPVIRNYADNARVAYEGGRPEKAAELYARAMERASLIDAPEEAGRNAYNLALCHISMGQPIEAQKWLQQAKLSFGGKPGTSLAKVMVAEAEVARLGGRPEEAVTQAQAALSLGAAPAEKAQAELLLAEMALQQGDMTASEKHYRKALYRVSKETNPSVRARLEAVAAKLIQSSAMKGDAAACLERRANWLKAAGDYSQMGLSLREAGAAYAASGRSAVAFELLARATVSLKSAGQSMQALNSAQQAAKLAQELNDPSHVERAAILLEGMKQ